jgi:hypothetical protein
MDFDLVEVSGTTLIPLHSCGAWNPSLKSVATSLGASLDWDTESNVRIPERQASLFRIERQ